MAFARNVFSSSGVVTLFVCKCSSCSMEAPASQLKDCAHLSRRACVVVMVAGDGEATSIQDLQALVEFVFIG